MKVRRIINGNGVGGGGGTTCGKGNYHRTMTTSQSHGGALYYIVEVPKEEYDHELRRRYRYIERYAVDVIYFLTFYVFFFYKCNF